MGQGQRSLSDQVYWRIKEGIMRLSYEPGAAVTENALSEEFGVSRTPVKIAINRLIDDGWLVSGFRKKVKVKEIHKQDVFEIYQIRRLFEERALRLIFERDMTWEYAHRLEERVVRIKAVQADLFEWEWRDTEFHLEIVKAYENGRILRFYQVNQEELVRIGMLSRKPPEHVDMIISRLYEFVAAMRIKDFDRAWDILRSDHLELGLEMALRQVGE